MSFNKVNPAQVRNIVERVMPAFGQDLVPDLEKSHGCFIHDALRQRDILDFFSYFATNALGHNHPATSNEDFRRELLRAALSNPSNSDFYTTQYANFIETFRKIAMAPEFRYAFYISGGTLAVENALKVAMDWKIKKNLVHGIGNAGPQQVIHFKEAFHGRSGYTLSLTNTKPVDTNYFTQFNWARIDNPKIKFPLTGKSLEEVVKNEDRAIEQIKNVLLKEGRRTCAIIIEPIQSEGGDNHFRNEFLLNLRTICDENELMLIFDEVQNGVGLTGKFWAYQHFDVVPDLLVFGKKMQVCGIMSTNRVDEVENNCFTVEGRLNSTWGGSLADMVHATQILRVIEKENLVENAAKQGKYILERLLELEKEAIITNCRGRGLQAAFDLPDTATRDRVLKEALSRNLLLLAAGQKSIRFRPALVIQQTEIDMAFTILHELVNVKVKRSAP